MGSLSALFKSDIIKVTPFLALAFYMAFIPHADYLYPLHIDDWAHIIYQNALLQSGNVVYPDPYSGVGSSGLGGLLELGYHLPLALFYQFSGLSWMDIARYFPSFVLMFTVLSVYIFANRISLKTSGNANDSDEAAPSKGFGWEAAFFVALIPSAVGVLGPALMVPVALGLAFVPLLLFLFFNYRGVSVYLLMGIILPFLVIMHAASAVIIITILVTAVAMGLKGNFKHSLWLALFMVIPFLVMLPFTKDLILSELGSLLKQKTLDDYHSYLSILSDFGYVPVVFSLLGAFVLMLKGGWRNRALVMALLVMLALLAIFYTFQYGIFLLYLRGIMYGMLLMAIVAGAGLVTLRRLDIPWLAGIKLKYPLITLATGVLLSLAVVGFTLTTTIPDRQADNFYHMIDDTDYETFVWIRDNLDPTFEKAILDPWKATAFIGITEKYVYTRTHAAASSSDHQAYDFIRGGSVDTAFLRENNISIVYTRVYDGFKSTPFEVKNPDLVKVKDYVYVLKETKTD